MGEVLLFAGVELALSNLNPTGRDKVTELCSSTNPSLEEMRIEASSGQNGRNGEALW